MTKLISDITKRFNHYNLDIDLKLDKDFVRAFKKMKRKYGEKFERMNGFHNENLNFTDFIDNFVDENNKTADVSIDANANSSSSDIRTLFSDMMKPHTKLLSYNKIFYELKKKYDLKTARQWLELEWNGSLYLHDAASSTFMPYCYAYTLKNLAEKGLYFIDKFKALPAKHLSSFNDHVLETISWLSNRSSGACGLPDYLIYSYYFWKKDIDNNFYTKDPIYYRDQCFQKFIYDLNQPYLRVSECAFTNISIMDKNYLVELFGGKQFPDGSFMIDSIDEILDYQKAFMEQVSKIRSEKLMTFPVLTYSLLYQNDKFVDEEFAKWCCKHNMQWNDSNFYMGDDVTSLSNCCRLISDTSKLDAFINSIGGTALSVGSIKVNTINLRRIALESGMDKVKYLEILKEKQDICVKTLDVIRGIIQRNVDKGLLPNYTYDLIEMDKQYNTVGITAVYEVIKDFGLIEVDDFGNHFYKQEGLDFAGEILDQINKQKDSYDFDYSINVECIPAERANAVLCKKDHELYQDKVEEFIYSNQWIPLMEQCTIQEKIKLGALLDKKCGGGQISHINIQSQMTNFDQAWELLNTIAKSGVIYFAYNTKISVCENEHGFMGDICPNCGQPVIDTYQRIVGYLVPSSSYSKERKLEFDNRKWFLLE